LTFTNVAIGISRLQYLLREIGPGKFDHLCWNANGEETPVLLLVSRDASHTLGVMVLAGQLRRLGYSVKISIGEAADALIATIQSSPFDAIFVSASMTDNLEDLRGLVKNIKMNSKSTPPIVLGGCIVEQGRDALQITGVDKVTNKLEEALSFCKLHCNTNL
jgi:methylmalonyl-CoA mutase cobalamin-binding subunit